MWWPYTHTAEQVLPDEVLLWLSKYSKKLHKITLTYPGEWNSYRIFTVDPGQPNMDTGVHIDFGLKMQAAVAMYNRLLGVSGTSTLIKNEFGRGMKSKWVWEAEVDKCLGDHRQFTDEENAAYSSVECMS